jgi:hypothetical protein
MEPVVYILGALTCVACAALLLRAYMATGTKLLLWSGICFSGLSVSNILLFLDLVVFPETDYFLSRLLTAAAAMMCMLYGLIWEKQQ